MTRRGRRARRARRLADMAAPPPPAWPPPPPEECEDHEYGFEQSTVGLQSHISVRFRRHRGGVVEFAFSQRVWRDGAWWPVVRVDTCHAEVHVHRFDQNGIEVRRTVRWPIREQADVERGMDEAYRIVVAAAEDNVAAWLHGG